MKKYFFTVAIFFPVILFAQGDFSPEAYMQFRQENKGLTVSQLLNQNPIQTTYYSSRNVPYELDRIPWMDTIDRAFSLTKDEKALLESNGFMVTERLTDYTWLSAFIQIYNRDLPLFLSTDFILFTLHQSYDEILKLLEYRMLEPNLHVLLKSMYLCFPETYEKYDENPDLLVSLNDVDIYLSIALTLLTGEDHAPRYASMTDYQALLTAIHSEKLVKMPLFTRADLKRKLDFSQFKPRGHYTDKIYTADGIKTLENYFRAMMWLGRIDFLMTAPPDNPWEEPWLKSDVLRMNISALLLNEVLHNCGKQDLLKKHEEVIGFMVGEDDNLTPEELQGLSDSSLEGITDLLNEKTFDSFLELLNGSDDYGQKIMSNFFYVDPDTIHPSQLPVSFRLLGQKFLIDSYIFSEVVFDRITFEGRKYYRMLPDPLDILSVFGNENAMQLMEKEMEEYKYAYKINELKYLVDAYDESYWTGSLYNTWLSAIMKLNPPSSSTGLPYFMQTSAWNHQKLNTQLTSWAQLRHDNILYAKQSYTGGTGCSFPYTYVEPYPEFFEYVSIFAGNAAEFFKDLLSDQYPELSQMIAGYYELYADYVGKLGVIARKEVAGESLTDEELIFLKTMINEFMASGPSVSGWILNLLFPAMDMWDFDFTVADVHTQPTEPNGAEVGNVLHVGNGMINLGVVIAPKNTGSEELIAYIGPVGSFHTQIRNNFYRMDDDEWKQLFMEGDFPPRPEWAYAYLANNKGDTIRPANFLKGIEFMGTEYAPVESTEIDYMLVYPNPAKDDLHIRFILDRVSDTDARLYDLSGRVIHSFFSGHLPPGEYDFPVPVQEFPSGIYLVRMNVNGRSCVKRCVIQ